MNKLIIFGASNLGKSAYYALKDRFEISYFSDNNSNLWGSDFEGIEIISPNKLKEHIDIEIIVASTYYKEITNQLFQLGFDYVLIYKTTIENNFIQGINKYNIDYETHGNIGCEYAIYPNNISQESIVYSFGAGEDISFEASLINKFGLKVYTFDPTPKSIEWVKKQRLHDDHKFYEIGISDFDGIEDFYLPQEEKYVSCSSVIKFNKEIMKVRVNKIDTIAKKFGHKLIDILKMDIEGSEYKVIRDILKSNVKVKQILVEFHHRFDDIGYVKTNDIIEEMKRYGYMLFYVSQTGEEFSFILQEN